MAEDQIAEDSKCQEDDSGRRSEICEKALDRAFSEAAEKSWPDVVLSSSLNNLGVNINNHYLRLYERFGSQNDKVQLANKIIWVTERSSNLAWLGRIDEGFVLDNETTRRYAESYAAGYFDDKAYAISDTLASFDFQKIFKLDKKLWYEPLEVIALIWFCEADELMGSGKVTEALDKLADAFSAMEQEHGFRMFDISQECSEEEKSSGARNAALKLHAATTHVRRNAIIDYWRANIGADKSNEFAAELLQKQFPEISHRTLARYVSEAKKIPPAGIL